MFPQHQTHAMFNHLRAEHVRLHRMLNQVARREQAWKEEGAKDDYLAALHNLYEALLQHFTEEEEGGCLEEAVAHCPSLASTALRMEDEHESLLQRLRQIIERLERDSLSEPEVKAAESRFHEFRADLGRHELAENRVLATAFGESP